MPLTTIKSSGFTKIRILLFYYALITVIYFLINIWLMVKYESDLKTTMTRFSFIFSLFILLFILLPTFWIMRKKYVNEITLDTDLGTMELRFSKKLSAEFSLDEIAFTRFKDGLYDVVVIYQKIKATRGHIIYAEAAPIIGFAINCGWSKKQLIHIERMLDGLGIEQHRGKKKSFLDRVFL